MNEPVMTDVVLTSDEMKAFNALLENRSSGRITVGPVPISRNQARALWRASKAFAPAPQLPVIVRSGPARRHELHCTGAVVALSAVALSGCATLGGNVKGSFSCRAPDGICAPTSKIDDQALAMIAGDVGQIAPTDAIQPPDRGDPMMIPVSGGAHLTRSTEKVLRIVFPAHVDRLGRYREASAIHAVVERGAWMTAAAGPQGVEQAVAPRMEQRAMSDASPSLVELASASPEVAFPQAAPDAAAVSSIAANSAPSPAPKPDLPSAAAVAAARREGHASHAATAAAHTAKVARAVSLQAVEPPKSVAPGVGYAAARTLVASPEVQPLSSSPNVAAPAAQGTSVAQRIPAPTAAMASTRAFDLRGVGGTSPIQAIRERIGSIFAARGGVKPAGASQATPPAKTEPSEHPVNGPSVLAVSGIDR